MQQQNQYLIIAHTNVVLAGNSHLKVVSQFVTGSTVDPLTGIFGVF